jgi:hypothetical protein
VTFDPVTPTWQSDLCSAPQFAGFGTGVALSGGGVAFRYSAARASSVSGWYVEYPSGFPDAIAPPAWIDAHDANFQLLQSGACLVTSSDPATCTRTAQLLGSDGQVCASLALDGSDDCNANEELSADGTVVVYEPSSCIVNWWPGLGAPRP